MPAGTRSTRARPEHNAGRCAARSSARCRKRESSTPPSARRWEPRLKGTLLALRIAQAITQRDGALIDRVLETVNDCDIDHDRNLAAFMQTLLLGHRPIDDPTAWLAEAEAAARRARPVEPEAVAEAVAYLTERAGSKTTPSHVIGYDPIYPEGPQTWLEAVCRALAQQPGWKLATPECIDELLEAHDNADPWTENEQVCRDRDTHLIVLLPPAMWTEHCESAPTGVRASLMQHLARAERLHMIAAVRRAAGPGDGVRAFERLAKVLRIRERLPAPG